MANYGFRLMTEADRPVAMGWLRAGPVAEWWDADEDFVEALADPNVRPWIVSLDGRPFAYVQDYDPHARADHHFAFLLPRSRGLDQFIGEPELIGRGHGSAFVRAFADRLFAEGAPAVGVDPDPANVRAIRAYEKAGFVAYPPETVQTAWGPALLMTRFAPGAREAAGGRS